MIEMLFWLLVAHSLADYPLQGEYLAAAKRRNSGHATPWWIALTAHSLIHAGFVAFFTSSILLGMCEFFAHWYIDYSKCEGWWPMRKADDRAFTIDQGLHVGCKLAWAALS